MGNCSGKNNRASKKYTRKRSKPGAGVDMSQRQELNDFDQIPGQRKDLYGGEPDADVMTKSLSYTPGNIDHLNYISPFDDSSKFMLAVNKDIKILSSLQGDEISTLPHPKQVTQCFAFNDDQNIISTCRDAIVRVWELDEDGEVVVDEEGNAKAKVELKGHKMSVTTGCISLGETVLATGARDYETILWDLEDEKKTHSKRIDRNMITDMKWLPSDNNTFIQCSEDLRLRFYDIREGLNMVKETVVGTNFAGTCDIDESGKYIVTGHKGFNNSGCYVKLWDVRTFSEKTVEPVFEYEHSYSVVSAKFLYTPSRSKGSTNIISASSDKTMKVVNLQGEQKTWTDCPDSYTAMCPLRNGNNANRKDMQDTDTLVMAGSTKPRLLQYSIDEETLSIVSLAESK